MFLKWLNKRKTDSVLVERTLRYVVVMERATQALGADPTWHSKDGQEKLATVFSRIAILLDYPTVSNPEVYRFGPHNPDNPAARDYGPLYLRARLLADKRLDENHPTATDEDRFLFQANLNHYVYDGA